MADGHRATPVPMSSSRSSDEYWLWIDIHLKDGEAQELESVAQELQFDRLAVQDAVADYDLPKLDDFGDHLLVILHGLSDDDVATYELDCFISETHLVTVHSMPSPTVEALWEQVQRNSRLAAGGPAEIVARLGDITTRRLLSVVEAFDDRLNDLVDAALSADPTILGEVTAVRSDLAVIRRAAHPQREVLDQLKRSESALVTDGARRRFSDVFDVATRATADLDAARAALAETLDAYRGAEAREATEVTKVLTMYAAIMLPLTLLVGFFGMNHPNLPTLDNPRGWIIVSAAMAVVLIMSFAVFVGLGWIQRPSARRAARSVGRGLTSAAIAPIQITSTLYQGSTGSTKRPRRKRTSKPD